MRKSRMLVHERIHEGPRGVSRLSTSPVCNLMLRLGVWASRPGRAGPSPGMGRGEGAVCLIDYCAAGAAAAG